MNRTVLLVALAAAAGFVAAAWLINPSSCCNTVTGAVRDKVAAQSSGLAWVGDRLGLWRYTAGLAGLVGGA